MAHEKDELDEYAYFLVLLEDASGYTGVAPTKACPASFTTKFLETWYPAFGTPTFGSAIRGQR